MKHFFKFVMSFISVALFSNTVLSNDEYENIWVAAGQGGIYHGRFDQADGEIIDLKRAAKGKTTYLVKHPSLNVLYAVQRIGAGSSIISYKIEDNQLTLQSQLDQRPSGGAHINISPNGNLLTVSYYGAGVVGVYGLGTDGTISSVFDEEQHQGTSVNLDRQTSSHVHWSGFSPDSKTLYVTDLGTDHLWVYKVNTNGLALIDKVKSAPGAGPRHIAFHPSQKFAYVSDELHLTVSIYRQDVKTAKLKLIQIVKATPGSEKESWSSLSDIKVHPSGKFLYVVSRGYDRVAVFKIDQNTGAISPVETEPIRGSISRNIDFSASGEWAFVVGRMSNTLAVFRLDKNTGELAYNHQLYSIPSPYSIVVD